MATLILSEV